MRGEDEELETDSLLRAVARIPAREQPPTTIGRFVVLKRLGAGGMGVVFAAYDPDLERKVAIKLVRSGGTPELAAHLLREAQAMAKLAHPNVVAVHEVGTVGAEVFIAMEYVDGETLTAHLETPRTWRATLRLFAQAGEGLVAAHAAGLVHRDFKPDNVLVSAEGRVRVTDFGLVVRTDPSAATVSPVAAASGTTATPAVSGTTAPSSAESVSEPLSVPSEPSSIAVVGTPAFMAPEQWQGAEVDARTDQFSFAIALYEALYGSRPFPGASRAELEANMRAGRIADPPPRSSVPLWVRRILIRALQFAPSARFVSMRAMLEALAEDPARRRRVAFAGVGVVAVLGSLGVLAWRRDDAAGPPPCTGFERRLSGIWDAPSRARLHDVFVATKRPFALDAWRGAAHTLDAYTTRWVALRSATCSASQAGEQSPQLLDLKMHCLDRRLGEVAALVQTLATADGNVVARAVSATQALAALDRCADPPTLMGPIPRPADPALVARIDALDPEFAIVKSLASTGQWPQARARAEEVGREARAIGWAPLTADVLERLASALERGGDPKQAETVLHEAIREADRGRDDAMRFEAYLTLLGVVGSNLERIDDAAQLEHDARAIMQRLPPDERREARLLHELSIVDYQAGRYEQALTAATRALEIRRRVFGADHVDVAHSLNIAGLAEQALGRHDQAIARFTAAIELAERTLGTTHPFVGSYLANRGGSELSIGSNAEAIADLRRAASIHEAVDALGDVAAALNNLSIALANTGDNAQALAVIRRVLAIQIQLHGESHSLVAQARINLGMVLLALEQFNEAEAENLRAIALLETIFSPTHPVLGTPIHNLGEQYLHQGRVAMARARFLRVIEILEASAGKDNPRLVESLGGLGRAELLAHDPRAARAILERARALGAKTEQAPPVLASVDFALARALWETAGDRARARELATAAQLRFTEVGPATAREAREVTEWLAGH